MSEDAGGKQGGGLFRGGAVAGAVVCVLVVLAVFGYIMTPRGRQGSLTVFYGGQKLATMDIKDGGIALDQMLRDLFRDNNREQTFRALVKELRQYYQIQDPALVLGIEHLSYDEPTAKGLRQLYEDGKGPFVPQEFDVRVNFASENLVPAGRGAICPTSDMFRKVLFVLGPEGRGATVIRADLQGACRGSEKETALLQISFTDARRLFGCGALRKEETVHAVERRFETPTASDNPTCSPKRGGA